MKTLIIIGSGELSREIFNYTKILKKKIIFKGFLDFTTESLKSHNLEKLYLGNEDEYKFSNSDHVLIAVADPAKRKKIFLKMKNKKNIKFFNYIHETAIINKNTVELGEGNFIGPYCILTHNIRLGDCNILNTTISIGHDSKIGSFNTFNSHCDITGNVIVGDKNFLGSRVSVLPGANIGNFNKISAGSVVYKNLNNKRFVDNGIYHGNPAKKIGQN